MLTFRDHAVRPFGHGGVVAFEGKNTQYEPPGETEPKVFESADARRTRRRAVVYGALDDYVGGDPPETERGVPPTSITNEGERTIAGIGSPFTANSPRRSQTRWG